MRDEAEIIATFIGLVERLKTAVALDLMREDLDAYLAEHPEDLHYVVMSCRCATCRPAWDAMVARWVAWLKARAVAKENANT